MYRSWARVVTLGLPDLGLSSTLFRVLKRVHNEEMVCLDTPKCVATSRCVAPACSLPIALLRCALFSLGILQVAVPMLCSLNEQRLIWLFIPLKQTCLHVNLHDPMLHVLWQKMHLDESLVFVPEHNVNFLGHCFW